MWESVSVKNGKSWNKTLEGEETCGGKVHETEVNLQENQWFYNVSYDYFWC